MSKKKNILFWPGWWYPNKRNRLEAIFIQKHAEAVSRFCNVYVLYIKSDSLMINKKYEPVYKEEDGLPSLKIYYKPFPNIPVIKKLIDLIRYIKASKYGLDFFKKKFGSPEIIHTHVNPPIGLIFMLFTRLKNIPFIHTEHWSGYLKGSGKYKGFIRKLLTRIFIKKAKVVTTVSEDLKNNMLRHNLTGNYAIIPNVVNTDLFVFEKEKRKKEKKRILHVSNFRIEKNIPGIIQVVSLLSKKRKDFELYLVGDGETRKKCETIVDEMGLKNKFVFFIGEKDVSGVAKEMQKSDLFLLFSNYENLPCVIIESFSSGLPVIATSVGGISEMVLDDNSVLIKPQDEKELFIALDTMLDNINMYDRKKIRQYAIDNYSYYIVGKQFFELYKNILIADL